MVNLQINDEKLKEDIELAKRMIYGEVITHEHIFHNESVIYATTNERIGFSVYRDSMKDKKRVLSITASGDQIINSILFGGEDITGIDISIFAKYFVALKIAALETLNKDEFLKYIIVDGDNYSFSKKLYEKVREKLDCDSKFFWDEIFNLYSETDVLWLFTNFRIVPEEFVSRNPYLQDSEFYKAKERIEQSKVTLSDFNVFDIKKMHFGKFDLILLSNVLDYLDNFLVRK